MDVRATFVAHTQTSILMQPAQGPFDRPAKYTEPATVLGISLGQNRFDSASAEFLPMGLRIVGAVALNTVGTATGPAGLTSDRRNGIDQRQQLSYVMAIGGRDLCGQWDTIGIGEDMMFRAGFPAIRGIGTSVHPPKTARTEAESTRARDQSILLALRRCVNKSWWSWSQTPALCQSRSRRQQVIPLPQPISCGRYSQGMPVLRTKRIPVRASRLPTGFRPGNRNLRGLGWGKIGSIRDHRESSRTTLAMSVPPCTGMSYIGNRVSFC